MKNGYDLLEEFLIEAHDSCDEWILTFEQISVFLDAAPEKVRAPREEIDTGLHLLQWRKSGFRITEVNQDARTVKFVRLR